MVEVESFTLDNNKVIAPSVRLISNEYEKKEISLFFLRTIHNRNKALFSFSELF